MKKYFAKITIYVASVIISVIFVFVFVVEIIPVQFDETYQYEINEKYDRLLSINEPKIIITGGSGTAFGLNQNIVESKTSMPVVNLALHAGFGMPFETEITKGNINEGDYVVLVYEYSQWSQQYWDSSLIMTAIDNEIEMYKYVPVNFVENTMKYFPTYASKKMDSFLGISIVSAYGTYSKSSFLNGNMVLDRPTCTLPDPAPVETFGQAIINPGIINSEVVAYVNEFNSYVTAKGAILLISFPPVLDEAVFSTQEEIMAFENLLDLQLEPPIISSVEDYIFDRGSIFDSIYHCNNFGEIKRSELISRDLVFYFNQANMN